VRTLTERELNRALLARQLLLDRAMLPIARALERVAGLQTQYAPSGYIGLWSRLQEFTRDDLTRALERRAAIQATMMRMTIHLVSPRDYWPLTEAVRESRRESWLKGHRGRVDPRRVEAVARRARKLLADGPRARGELVEALGADNVVWAGVGLWLDLVRVPPSGTWERRRADLYALAEQWVGPPTAETDRAVEHLVRRYLGGFGPASVADLVSWSGLSRSRLAPTIERLGLRRFRDERGGELLDLPRAPLPDGDTPAPVRFLPTWDATLLVHARRTQILPERFRPRVFNTRTPHSLETFLVDGQVAGTWKYERGRVRVEPFERLSRAQSREVAEEADRLSEFLSL
jgi:hypothetical protein